MLKQRAETLGVHLILIAYCLLAVGPILLVVMNSFKARKAIFGAPLAPPNADTFSLVGYNKVFAASHIWTYFCQLADRHPRQHVLRPPVRRDGGLGADRIQVPRFDRARALPVDRHHGADPARIGRDPQDDARGRPQRHA